MTNPHQLPRQDTQPSGTLQEGRRSQWRPTWPQRLCEGGKEVEETPRTSPPSLAASAGESSRQERVRVVEERDGDEGMEGAPPVVSSLAPPGAVSCAGRHRLPIRHPTPPADERKAASATNIPEVFRRTAEALFRGRKLSDGWNNRWIVF